MQQTGCQERRFDVWNIADFKSTMTRKWPFAIGYESRGLISIATVFLGVYAKFRKATIAFDMSVRLHGTTRLPRDGFSLNLVSEVFFFENPSTKFKFELNPIRITGTLHDDLPYLLTYLLTPWCRVLLEKLTGLQLVKKFPAFHVTRRFITALTSVRHLSLSWDSPIQSIYPHPTSWRFILILFTHLRLGFPSGLFPSGFPTRPYTPPPLSSPIRATYPAHLILLDFITRKVLGEEYKSFSRRKMMHQQV